MTMSDVDHRAGWVITYVRRAESIGVPLDRHLLVQRALLLVGFRRDPVQAANEDWAEWLPKAPISPCVEDRMTGKDQWIDAYAMKVGALGVDITPQRAIEIAETVFPLLGHEDPVEAAERDWRYFAASQQGS